jgi:hypothetical protein
MRRVGHIEGTGERRGVYRVLVGKPERKRPLERPRRRWVDNIKMYLQEVGCGGMDWINLAQVAFECGNEPSGSTKAGNFFTENLLASQEGLCSMEYIKLVEPAVVVSLYILTT